MTKVAGGSGKNREWKARRNHKIITWRHLLVCIQFIYGKNHEDKRNFEKSRCCTRIALAATTGIGEACMVVSPWFYEYTSEVQINRFVQGGHGVQFEDPE